MTVMFPGVAPSQLDALVDAVRRRVMVTATAPALMELWGQAIPSAFIDQMNGLLAALGADGAAVTLTAIADERRAAYQAADRRLELVWTGPERVGAGTRDTAVVVRELFEQAERSVIVSGYALYGGRSIFDALAVRMVSHPALRARFCLNIEPSPNDQRSDDAIVSDFRRRFKEQEWPGERLPELYFDPRALERVSKNRAVLHAKCVVIDDRRALVTSANPTVAALVRNIEAGVLISDPVFATSLRLQFDDLIDRGILAAVF